MRSPLLLCLASGLAGLVLCLSACDKKKTGPAITAIPESATERSEAIAAAFVKNDNSGSRTYEPDSPVFKEVDEFFTKLGKASRESRSTAYLNAFSPEAMLNHLEGREIIGELEDKERSDLIRGLRTGFSRGFKLMGFDRHVLVRLEETAPSQLLAFTRTYDNQLGAVAKIRWWLFKENGAWKIYDMEELSQGVRISTLLGAALSGTTGGKKPWTQAFGRLGQKSAGITPDNLLDVLGSLQDESEELIRLNAPAEIQSYVRMLLVTALITNGEFEQALERLEEAGKLENPTPFLSYLKGVALYSLEKPVEARAEFERHAAAIGWDRDVHEMVAECYLSEANKEKAFEHAMKAVADHKESPDSLAVAAVTSPLAGIADLKKHFEATANPESTYETAIDYAIDHEEMENAKAVFALLKAFKPESELIEYYEEEFTAEAGARSEAGEAEDAEDAAMEEEEAED